MISTQDIRPRIDVSVGATIANWDYLTPILNTAGWVLDANGASVTTATSSILQIGLGGFPNQIITASLKFITPTTAGNEELGVMGRFLTNKSPDATYYYLRQISGQIRLVKVVDGTFTTLASAAYALAQDTWADFTLTMNGSAIEGTIDDGSTSVTLNATDSDIANGGFCVRSGPTNAATISMRSFRVQEAA